MNGRDKRLANQSVDHYVSPAAAASETKVTLDVGCIMRFAFAYMFHLIVHNRAFLRLIGWLNRRWHFLSTLFVMYPATEEYTRAYGPKRMWHIMRWSRQRQ